MKLYGYWRSSASWRVRIACHLKNVKVTPVEVDLKSGDHLGAAHGAVNPQHLVPVLELDDGRRLTQSLAILAFLDGAYPAPPLLPADPYLAARARACALTVACDIHPMQNLRVLQAVADLGADRTAWAANWITRGLAAIESLLPETAGSFCVGDAVSVADLCLVPQLYNARRFAVDLAPFPQLRAIEATCLALPPFHQTAPTPSQ